MPHARGSAARYGSPTRRVAKPAGPVGRWRGSGSGPSAIGRTQWSSVSTGLSRRTAHRDCSYGRNRDNRGRGPRSDSTDCRIRSTRRFRHRRGVRLAGSGRPRPPALRDRVCCDLAATRRASDRGRAHDRGVGRLRPLPPSGADHRGMARGGARCSRYRCPLLAALRRESPLNTLDRHRRPSSPRGGMMATPFACFPSLLLRSAQGSDSRPAATAAMSGDITVVRCWTGVWPTRAELRVCPRGRLRASPFLGPRGNHDAPVGGTGRYGSGWPRAFKGPMARAKMCMPLMRPLAGMLPPLGRVMACTVLPALSGADV
jgi:hypothetical protein